MLKNVGFFFFKSLSKVTWIGSVFRHTNLENPAYASILCGLRVFIAQGCPGLQEAQVATLQKGQL